MFGNSLPGAIEFPILVSGGGGGTQYFAPTWVPGYDSYALNNIVAYNGQFYVCAVAGTLEEPGTGTDWTLYAAGTDIKTLPVYDALYTYALNNMIAYNGKIYKSLSAGNTGNEPGIPASVTWWAEYVPNGAVLFKGEINAAADFPAIADVQVGWYYIIGTNVTDNDPTKTNTGQSFLAGDEIIWNGSLTLSEAWSELGENHLLVKTGTDLLPATPGDTFVSDDVRLGNGQTWTSGLYQWVQTDKVDKALFDVNKALDKLVPDLPPYLSATSLSTPSTYTALRSNPAAGAGTLDACTTNTTPTYSTLAGFFKGYEDEILSCTIDSAPAGSIIIDENASQAGVSDLSVGIVNDTVNFWRTITARILPSTPLAVGNHTVVLAHSGASQGSISNSSLWIDDPQTPTIDTMTAVAEGGLGYVSGVPTLQVDDTVTCGFKLYNAVRKHYRQNIAAISCPDTTDLTLNPVGTPAESDVLTFASKVLTVEANKYRENVQVSFVGYAANGGASSTYTANTNARVDTVSNESGRILSGSGQFPAFGSYGGAYLPATSLAVYTEELQLLNGKYQWPANANYTGNAPEPGPDYTLLGAGTRYTIVKLSNFLDGNKVIDLYINNIENFAIEDGNGITPGITLHAKVQTDVGDVTGWVDCNASYIVGSDPSANGAPAMTNSTRTSSPDRLIKRFTFGAIGRTGHLFLRIGITDRTGPKRFSGLSAVIVG